MRKQRWKETKRSYRVYERSSGLCPSANLKLHVVVALKKAKIGLLLATVSPSLQTVRTSLDYGTFLISLLYVLDTQIRST